MKKSQVSMFIIIGILLLLIIGVVIYLTQQNKINRSSQTPNLEKVKGEIASYMQACIRDGAPKILSQIAFYGGSVNSSEFEYYMGKKYSVLAYQTADETILTPIPLSKTESEASSLLAQYLYSCVNLHSLRSKGITIEEERQLNVSTKISNSDAVIFEVVWPLKISQGESATEYKGVTETINIPFRELYDTAIDILNAETEPAPVSKEKFMLENPGLSIEIYRPYPHTVYFLKKRYNNQNFSFNFVIRGKDTIGKEILKPKSPTRPVCIDAEHEVCYQNTICNFAEAGVEKKCGNNRELKNYGCCILKDKSCVVAETEKECAELGGEWNKKSCDAFRCPNFDCPATYDSRTMQLTGESRVNSESWCIYDSRPGWGRDYVGSRHYKHSCIYGKEYIEECRDYREELCDRHVISAQGIRINTAECKTNRWFDCAAQTSSSACKDISKRDCMWMPDYYSPWYTKNKCTPFVPPGFKPGEGADICNYASEDFPDIALQYPKTWSYSNFLSCIRMGDCGNYRNVADKIAKNGYFHPFGEPEPWVYWDNGWIYDGNEFGVTGLSGYYHVGAMIIARGSRGSFVVCSRWQPPQGNADCELCNNPYHPCSEYKCKSLGRNCIFSNINGVPKCSTQEYKPNPIKITFDKSVLTKGYSVSTDASEYYFGAIKNVITPDVPCYTNFTFGIVVDRPARCALGLKPPMVPMEEFLKILDIGFNPNIWLSGAQLSTRHNITVRFPKPEPTKLILPKWQIFVHCTDDEGNENEKSFYVEINVLNTSQKPSPNILAILPNASSLNYQTTNSITLVVDKPFSDCRYATSLASYDSMTSLGCYTSPLDMSLDINYGIVYLCQANILIDSENYFFKCSDAMNNTSTDYAPLHIDKIR
ncbi:MAG: hypothetical protein QXK37_06525 [Candidatus Woesearchaeota archaeon]